METNNLSMSDEHNSSNNVTTGEIQLQNEIINMALEMAKNQELLTGVTQLPLVGPILTPLEQKEEEILAKAALELSIDKGILELHKDIIVEEKPNTVDGIVNNVISSVTSNNFIGKGKTGGLGFSRLIDVLAVPALSQFDLDAKRHDVQLILAQSDMDVNNAHNAAPVWISVPSNIFYPYHNGYPRFTSYYNSDANSVINITKESRSVMLSEGKNVTSQFSLAATQKKKRKADNIGLVGIETNPGPKIVPEKEAEVFKQLLDLAGSFKQTSNHDISGVFRDWWNTMNPTIDGQTFSSIFTTRLDSGIQDFHSWRNVASGIPDIRNCYFTVKTGQRHSVIKGELAQLGEAYNSFEGISQFSSAIRINSNLLQGDVVGQVLERCNGMYEGNYIMLLKFMLYTMDRTWGQGFGLAKGWLDWNLTSRNPIANTPFVLAVPRLFNFPRSNFAGANVAVNAISCTMRTYANHLSGFIQNLPIDYKVVFWKGGSAQQLAGYLLLNIEYPYKYLECEATSRIITPAAVSADTPTTGYRNTSRIFIPDGARNLLIVAINNLAPTFVGATAINIWDGNLAPAPIDIRAELDAFLAIDNMEVWQTTYTYLRDEITPNDYKRALWSAATLQDRNYNNYIYGQDDGTTVGNLVNVQYAGYGCSGICSPGVGFTVRNYAGGAADMSGAMLNGYQSWSFTGAVTENSTNSQFLVYDNNEFMKAAIAMGIFKVKFLGSDDLLQTTPLSNLAQIYMKVHSIAEQGFYLFDRHLAHIGLCSSEAIHDLWNLALTFNVDKPTSARKLIIGKLNKYFGQIQTTIMEMSAIKTETHSRINGGLVLVHNINNLAFTIPNFTNKLKYSVFARMGTYRPISDDLKKSVKRRMDPAQNRNVYMIESNGSQKFDTDEIGETQATLWPSFTDGILSSIGAATPDSIPGLGILTYSTNSIQAASIGMAISPGNWAINENLPWGDSTHIMFTCWASNPPKWILNTNEPTVYKVSIPSQANSLPSTSGYLGTIINDKFNVNDLVLVNDKDSIPDFGDMDSDSFF